jgi:hypothetical protein
MYRNLIKKFIENNEYRADWSDIYYEHKNIREEKYKTFKWNYISGC